MVDAAPQTEFVCFGRPVRDAVGFIVNSLTVTVAAVTLGLAAAALVDGTEVTLVFARRKSFQYGMRHCYPNPSSGSLWTRSRRTITSRTCGPYPYL